MIWTRLFRIITVRCAHDNPRVNSGIEPCFLLYPASRRLNPHPLSILNPQVLRCLRINVRYGISLKSPQPGNVLYLLLKILRESTDSVCKSTHNVNLVIT
jgi:hypothetical protein